MSTIPKCWFSLSQREHWARSDDAADDEEADDEQQRRDHGPPGQPLVLHRLFVKRHFGVLLAERLEILLVVEVLRLQREPFRHRTARTDRLAFQPLRFDVAGAGDCPAVRTVGVRLVAATRVTMDVAVDAVLGGHS